MPNNGKSIRCPIHGRIEAVGKKCVACAALEYNRQVAAGERKPLIHHPNGNPKENDPSPLVIRFRAIRERRYISRRMKRVYCYDERQEERSIRVVPDPGV